ncbi:type II secretion system protein GspD [Spongiimicrobium salis]|uniref:type II secretion system protein GspD n=1 Tax=Spongiimicrobium salis TaxID=1667022 RepID=UPI00374DB047
MKKSLLLLFCFITICSHAQEQDGRLQNIKNNLELLAVDNPGLTENLKVDINITNVTLPNFILAVSKLHRLNITVDPSLQNINFVKNFSNVTVADLLIFICKTYDLDIDFTGNIMSIRKYNAPPPPIIEKELLVNFDAINNYLSLDLNNDPLDKVFRKIIDVSGQNLLYNNGMENLPLNLYVNNVPFEIAIEKLAELNGLIFSKSRDGFYLFSTNNPDGNASSPGGGSGFSRGGNYNYQVVDTINRVLNVDFENVPVVDIINEISHDLNLNIYVATPLEEAGNVTFKAKQIYYDTLLERIFENATPVGIGFSDANNTASGTRIGRTQGQNAAQNPPIAAQAITSFTFKKENDIYFFGTGDQLSVRKVEVIQMMHRSIELLSDPTPYSGGARSAGRTSNSNINFVGGGGLNNQGFNNNQGLNNGGLRNNNGSRRIDTRSTSFQSFDTNVDALVNILPDDVKTDLDIKIDLELNSFLVSGPTANINRFKTFIKEIDKPVPMVLIEVMILEVRKSSTVETGISWGIGDAPVETRGGIFPETNITLGANTVNKIIGGFDGFGSFNIGRVVPNFFATIQAMETNGNLKIRSSPKLSTMNGHRANLSIGETQYYVVTSQNFFGSQIPTTSEIRNFQPIDAELGISIKPLVSGNGQVTLDINVVQSDFNGERIEEDAPPGLTSREFSSIIRMQNQDIAILGGLEEKVKNDAGSGVPFLARIPVIKWLFSKKRREDRKQKLTILIKPTVIYQ